MRNHYSIFSFSLSLSYLERRFVTKHNPHIFKVYKVFWSLGNFEDLPKKADEARRMQSDILRDLKSQCRQDSKKSVGSRNLEGSSTLNRLDFEDLLLFVYFNLFTSKSISTRRVAKRFFAEFFSFLFDNISWCYIVFTSLFPYSCTLLLLLIVHVYALK